MKYLVIGVGGTGGCIGGYLAAGHKDVTLIARGAHLKAIQENGLTVQGTRMGDLQLDGIKAVSAEDYHDKADVIFICVKGYALDGIVPLLEKASHKDTIIIPILNLVGTGGRLAQRLPELTILDGCIYVAAYISAPGVVVQTGSVMRIVCGEREGNAHAKKLAEIAADLTACQIDVTLSDNIRADAFRKYMFVSAFAAAGAYHDVTTTELQQEGASRDTFVALVHELDTLAKAQGFTYDIDVAEDSVKRIMAMGSGATASMQKDLKKGGESEIDGMIFEAVRIGRRLGVAVPMYCKIAEHFGFAE